MMREYLHVSNPHEIRMALNTQLRTDFGDPEEILLQRIRQRVNSAVSKLATEHYLRNTEEPTLTARLIQLIEERLQQEPVDVPGLKFEWESQTMGSIGRTEEANSGADIYISIVREDNGRHDSKGMLVQAKRQDSLERRWSERVRLGTSAARCESVPTMLMCGFFTTAAFEYPGRPRTRRPLVSMEYLPVRQRPQVI
jgi:hypothetical protein